MRSREERAAAFVRRMNAERAEIKLHNRLMLSLPLAWLVLQAVLFLAASMICSCCALSSYLWGRESPYLTLPSLGQLAVTATAARAGTPTRTIFPSGLATATTVHTRTPAAVGVYTDAPTATMIASTRTSAAPFPVETVMPGTPTPSLLTPTSGASAPTRSPSPQPTPPISPSVPTGTPQSLSFSTDLRIAHVERSSFLSFSEDGEYIVIENTGDTDQDMTRWTITNDRLDTYRFPAGYAIRARASVRVWTKSGTDTETDLYWGNEKEVWNSSSGTAYLRNPSGTLMALLHW
jgi:hypothetical protein